MLKETEFFGEFGYELISVLPYAYWLHKNKKLGGTHGAKDTGCLYYFSPHHVEKDVSRKDIGCKGFPIDDIHVPDISTASWEPPPYKAQYANSRFVWPKPLCVISNKYQSEWGKPPVNFIPLSTLRSLFSALTPHYRVVYNRPQKEVTQDNSQHFDLGDFQMIEREFPQVIILSRLWKANSDLSFNTLQLSVYANCSAFISVQGGGGILSSYFGGKNIILAKEGRELVSGSFERWYGKLSRCKVTAVQDEAELLKSAVRAFVPRGKSVYSRRLKAFCEWSRVKTRASTRKARDDLKVWIGRRSWAFAATLAAVSTSACLWGMSVGDVRQSLPVLICISAVSFLQYFLFSSLIRGYEAGNKRSAESDGAKIQAELRQIQVRLEKIEKQGAKAEKTAMFLVEKQGHSDSRLMGGIEEAQFLLKHIIERSDERAP